MGETRLIFKVLLIAMLAIYIISNCLIQIDLYKKFDKLKSTLVRMVKIQAIK